MTDTVWCGVLSTTIVIKISLLEIGSFPRGTWVQSYILLMDKIYMNYGLVENEKLIAQKTNFGYRVCKLIGKKKKKKPIVILEY